jgi:hypothetical protein
MTGLRSKKIKKAAGENQGDGQADPEEYLITRTCLWIPVNQPDFAKFALSLKQGFIT